LKVPLNTIKQTSNQTNLNPNLVKFSEIYEELICLI